MNTIQRTLGCFVLVNASAGFFTAGVSAATASSSLAEADRLFAAGAYDEARAAYSAFVENPPREATAESLGGAHLRLGFTLEHLGRYDDAITSSKRVIRLEDANPSLRESSYGNLAQWEIAKCLFRQGNYRAAVDALHSAERDHPFRSFCGNALGDHGYLYHFNQAVLHEYLHDYSAAVGYYFAVMYHGGTGDHLRLLHLYEAAGRLPDLLALLDAEDRRYATILEEVAAEYPGLKRPPVPELSPASRTIHRILEIRRLEEARDWNALLEIVSPTVGGGGADVPEEFDKEEAARILARHPRETVPMLLDRLNAEPVRGNFPRSICYALGLSGVPEAVAALKARIVVNPQNVYYRGALAHDLDRAGPLGQQALEELHAGGSRDMVETVEWLRSGGRKPRPGDGYTAFPFPPIPGSLELPTRCEVRREPRDEYAYICTREPDPRKEDGERIPRRTDR